MAGLLDINLVWMTFLRLDSVLFCMVISLLNTRSSVKIPMARVHPAAFKMIMDFQADLSCGLFHQMIFLRRCG